MAQVPEVNEMEKLAEVVSETELRSLGHIDLMFDYVPDLARVKRRDLAEKLVHCVDESTDKIGATLNLMLTKMAKARDLELMAKSPQLDETKKEHDPDLDVLHEYCEKINSLLALLELDEPYEPYIHSLSNEKNEGANDHIPDYYMSEFTPVRRFTAFFWKREEHVERIEKAQERARNEIKLKLQVVFNSVIELTEGISQSLREDASHAGESKKLFYGAVNYEELGKAVEGLKNSLDKTISNRALMLGLDKLNQFLENVNVRCPSDFGWYIHKIQLILKKCAEIYSSLLVADYDDVALKDSFQKVVFGAKIDISNQFETTEYLSSSFENEPAVYSITKEFLEAIKRLNAQIKTAGAVLKVPLGCYEGYYLGSIQEAEKISSGRLFTHSGSSAAMYKILERGHLDSVSQQKNKHGSVSRTHNNATVDSLGSEVETHDICFEVDAVYRNFSSDEERIKRESEVLVSFSLGPSKIVTGFMFVFGENQLVEGRQFADIDGIHLFDDQYIGENPDTCGLSIDLFSTPFKMLVSTKEKERLVKFLKEKSVFKDELLKLDAKELDEWFNARLMVVPNIDNYKFTASDKQAFYETTGLKPRKGYMEVTDTVVRFKCGYMRTKRFVPCKST